MNDRNQKRKSNQGLNGQLDKCSSPDAESTVEALEAESRIASSLDADSLQTYRYGAAIKQIANQDLPESDMELRQAVLQRLEQAPSGSVAYQPVKSATKQESFAVSRMALAACLLLATGLVALVILQGALLQDNKVADAGVYEEAKDGLTPHESEKNDDLVGVPVEKSASISSEMTDKKVVEDVTWMAPEKAPEKAIVKAPEKAVVLAVQPPVSNQPANFRFYEFGLNSTDPATGLYFAGQQGQVDLNVVPRFADGKIVNGALFQEYKGFAVDVDGISADATWEDPRLRPESGEQYDPIHETSFVSVEGQLALSTFSIDVDTASYSNMRRFLRNSQRPPRNSIRIEELVNYFSYDYPQPKGNHPFSVNMEMASCPWNEKHHLLRVGLKGKEIHREERSPTNLVFLLDVSGSMQSADKLPLLKQGLTMMVQQLTENDFVSIVTYSGNAGVVLQPTGGSNRRQIETAIEQLSAGGSTNGSAGINLAYELAQKQFIKGGANRVVLATDGDLNVGVTDDNELVKLIKEKASEGVFLTVLGFGTGNLKDSKLEKLADNGNGMYAYIDSFREAHKVLIEQISGSLETIAKDVKIQIEFNPGEVSAYRLIGYENRLMAAKEFDDDRKDAGEIGAGHSVTALYELVLADSVASSAVSDQPLKYQETDSASAEESTANIAQRHPGEKLTLSLRYKKPDANESSKIQFTLDEEPVSFSSASNDFQFASAVASFGMILRNSKHRGKASLEWVETTAARCTGADPGGYRVEFLDLVRQARKLPLQ